MDKNTIPEVTLGDKIIPWKSSVIYLGSLFVEDGNVLAAFKHRICCAETVVKRLNPSVFQRQSVSNQLTGKFINTAVFASLLYSLQYCKPGKRELRCLDRITECLLHLLADVGERSGIAIANKWTVTQ